MLALVVTRGVSPWLPDALRALAASRRAPERVVVAVVDPGAVVAVSTLCQESGLAHADVVPAAGAATFGAAARAVLDRFPATRNQWLWLLHDDAAPTPTALTAQLAAVEQAQSVVIVGAKNVEWNAPDELISVGVGMTPSGRRFTAMEESEIDQGQYDDRSDVLAVPLAGALVRRDVWDALGGPDPALGPYGDGADLTRRARLAGHRVVVAPRAVVRHARASYLSLRSPEHGPPGPSAEPDTERSWAARRQAVLHSRLAGTSGVGFVLAFLGMYLLAPVRALGRVATKEFGLIGAELRSPFVATARLGAVFRARSRARATAVLPRRVLRPLQVGLGARLAVWRDARLQAAASRRAARARSELEIAEAAALARKRRWVLLGVAVLTVGVAAVALAPLIFAGPLTGGGLLPVSSDVHRLWQDAVSPWLAVGDGHALLAQPFLLVLAGLTVLLGGLWGTPVWVAVTVLLVGAVPLAGLGAWFAAGAATRSRAARAWAALAWALMPPLLLGVSQGRIGAVLAHVTLPWVALGIARALGVQARDVILSGMVGARRVHVSETDDADGRVDGAVGDPAGDPAASSIEPTARRRPAGSIAAAAAAGLVLAVASAGAPVLLPLSIAVVVVLLVLLPRRVRGRARLLLVPLPSIMLLGPWLAAPFTATEEAGALDVALRRLLGEAGVPVAYTQAAPWQSLLLWPSDPTAESVTAPLTGSLLVLAIATGASVLVGALVALLRSGPRAPGVRLAWLVAVLGLAAALLLPLVPVGTVSGADTAGLAQPVADAWPGPALSLLLLGLLVAGTCAIDGARDRLAEASFGWRQASGGILALVLGAGVGLAGAGWIALLRTPDAVLVEARGDRPVPALGLQVQDSAAASRVLSILPTAEGLDVQLWRADGPQLLDAALASDALTGSLLDPTTTAPDAATQSLAVAVSQLTVSADEAVPGLVEHAIAAVVVPPAGSAVRPGVDETAAATLAAALDGTAGLERVTTNASGTVWRVVATDGVARVRVLDAESALPSDTVENAGPDLPVGALASEAVTARGSLAPSPDERVVVLADRAAPGWRATLDGRELETRTWGWQQAFTVPADASGTVRIEYDDPARTAWGWAQGIVLGLVALLALPTRRREDA
ncbi:GT2 family glycosyltransferase [Salana multivorans]|uniref:GT2 family glycosyltransferase n=1 Tax=Salana multivorans TaxID=120377 RepID=A0A3N2D7H8_9MICO|nr:glycosyltransferase [Salana multivorans]ROR95731.1 GT2 family glycosyltransferase [Salana multivorans]